MKLSPHIKESLKCCEMREYCDNKDSDAKSSKICEER